MRTKDFIQKLEHERIVRAIGEAEKKTSGEIRVFVQRGELDDPIVAAREQFEKLGMTATQERNAVLIFVAPRSQKFAVIGDRAIHERCGDAFWEQLVGSMRERFKEDNFTDALVHAIDEAGNLLAQHFPHSATDRNELTDAVEEG